MTSRNFHEVKDLEEYEFGLPEIVTPKLCKLISDLPAELTEMEESELIESGRVNDNDWKLRIKFWQEFRTIMDPSMRGRRVPKMKLTNIYKGVVDATQWAKKIENPFKLAFIIRPINSFEEETELILQIGAKRLWELVTMDITGKDGKVDPKRGQLLLQAVGMAADRARGLAVMRSQSVNVNVDRKDVKKGSVDNLSDIKELDSKIEELQKKLAVHNADAIDAEVVDD